MMTRLVKFLFLTALILLVAGLVAPSFIDWNKHKPKVMAQLSPYFQRKVEVGGNISFRILPQPELLLEKVAVADAAGSLSSPVLTLKSLEARVALGPLLQGRVEVESVNLTEPVLNFEILPDGRTSLSGVVSSGGNFAGAVQLNQVSITHGTLRYGNRLTGTQKTFEDLNLSLMAATLLGPYRIAGDMRHQGRKAAINIDTGVFDKTRAASAHIVFMPEGDMPQIKINGVLALQSGMDIEGELAVSGKLSGLANTPSLNGLDFLGRDADMTANMSYKGDKLSLTDIKAKFGKQGSLGGKLSVQLPRSGIPAVQADLEGNGLVVSDKNSSGYMPVPADFQGDLRFRGRNIVWEGRRLGTADVSLSFRDKDWVIKSAKLGMPGNSDIKLAGTVTPKTDSAAYTTFEVATEDAGKLVDSFAPDGASIFSLLGGAAAPFKKLELSGSLNVSPAQISLFNLKAAIDGNKNLSGVINVNPVAEKPNVTAKLHLDGWDAAAFPDAFVQSFLKADADLELTANNFTQGSLKATDLSFKGKTDEKGLALESLSGKLSESESFTLSGHAASLAPVAGLEASYTLKAGQVESVVKTLGVELPPLAGQNADLKGLLRGDAGKYAFTAEGTAESLTLFRQTVSHAAFALDATARPVIKVAALTGTIWDGKLSGDLAYTEQVQPAPSWSSAFKGEVKQADLQKFQDLLGLKGFTTGVGDIGFDLASADSTAASATGSVSLSAASVTLKDFNAEKLADALLGLTEMPENLQGLAEETLRKNGPTVFRDVRGSFTLDRGKATISSLPLTNAAEKLSVSGTAEFPAGSYAVSGELQLAKPEGFPALKVQRTSKDADFKVDAAPLKAYITRFLPAPEPPPAPAEPVAAPPPAEDQPIGNILKRLDDAEQEKEPEKEVEPVSPPVPLTPQAAPSPQEMMEQQMQEEDFMPVPLSPSMEP